MIYYIIILLFVFFVFYMNNKKEGFSQKGLIIIINQCFTDKIKSEIVTQFNITKRQVSIFKKLDYDLDINIYTENYKYNDEFPHWYKPFKVTLVEKTYTNREDYIPDTNQYDFILLINCDYVDENIINIVNDNISYSDPNILFIPRSENTSN